MPSKKILVVMPKKDVSNPVINNLIKNYNVTVSILRAKITPEEEGHMLVDLSGSEEDIAASIAFLESENNEILDANKGLQWKRDKCVHCGNCLSHCPTGALFVRDRVKMRVEFDIEKCIECLNCIKNCPFDACSSIF